MTGKRRERPEHLPTVSEFAGDGHPNGGVFRAYCAPPATCRWAGDWTLSRRKADRQLTEHVASIDRPTLFEPDGSAA